LEKNPQIALIISDIMMPVMDGFEFITEVKSRDEYRHLPTIALTAKSDVQDKIKALRIGVDDYVTKPFDQEELLVRIEKLLERLDARKSAQSSSTNITHEVTNLLSPSQVNGPLVVMSEEDHQWLEELEEKILEHMDDGRFSMDFISSLMNLSRRQLQRRLKRSVGLTPKEYINEIRMIRAMRMLETGKKSSVKAVADAVGFSTSTYFSKLFKQRFGKTPASVIDLLNGEE
jgi:YesN/AraC family two-component response regulator